MTHGSSVAVQQGPAELVRGVSQVASPPLVYQRLQEVINHPMSGAADIARVIREDMGLASRLLRVVNSAFFAFPRRIETISQAITVVGTTQIRDLALATSVMTMFRGIPSDLIDMESFWRHSLACGVGARIIASHRRDPGTERYFLAGLLHDIGRLIMFSEIGGTCREIMEESRTSGEPLNKVERTVLGFDHGHVGGALIEQWNLPGSLRESVEYHHRPRQATLYPTEAAAVHVADIMSIALGCGSSGETRLPPLIAEAWAHLGLDTATVPVILSEFEDQYEAGLQLIEGVLAN